MVFPASTNTWEEGQASDPEYRVETTKLDELCGYPSDLNGDSYLCEPSMCEVD